MRLINEQVSGLPMHNGLFEPNAKIGLRFFLPDHESKLAEYWMTQCLERPYGEMLHGESAAVSRCSLHHDDRVGVIISGLLD
nr:hypothetical protein [Xanthomonas arboricola]